MNALRTTFRDTQLKKNNKRALAIHFCLTLIGLPLAVFVNSVADNHNLGFFALGPVIGIIAALIIAPLAYIVCGYMYLSPVRGTEKLSLLWLTCMTVGWSLLASIALLIFWLAPADSPLLILGGIVSIPLGLLVNAIGFGSVLALASISDALGFAIYDYSIVPILMVTMTWIIPPGLLYLGMRLRQRYPNLIKSAEPSQSKTGNKEEDGQDWSNSACENFNWENEAK